MKEVYDFLKASATYYLATTDGNQPRVRPFGTILDFENKLYFQTSKLKNVYKQLIANPKIEISATIGTQWIRVEATTVADDRLTPKEKMLEDYPSLKSMYAANDDKTAVFYLKDAVATFYSFAGEPRVVRF
ncbi:pyridoxamine 5'-phosphate oxidase [Bacteroidia bacterium]|nr:pyridoxamine 5'-phosphate oxidase [Bacteroidia bacterium]